MSSPTPRDPAVPAIGLVIDALEDAFTANSSFPPRNPTDKVRLFAGEGPAMAAWDTFSGGGEGCDEPFVWVRMMRRFRTRLMPEPAETTSPCQLPRAIQLEVGVGRCAVVDEQPALEDYENEALELLEDSWRVERALCVAAQRLTADSYDVSTGEIEPFGPEGGIIGWTSTISVQFD